MRSYRGIVLVGAFSALTLLASLQTIAKAEDPPGAAPGGAGRVVERAGHATAGAVGEAGRAVGATARGAVNLVAPAIPRATVPPGVAFGDNRADPWRYVNRDGRWWYWAPDNRWMIYGGNGGWVYYQPAQPYTAAYGSTDVVVPGAVVVPNPGTYYYPGYYGGYYYGYPGYYWRGRYGYGLGYRGWRR